MFPEEEPDVTETKPTHMDDAWTEGKDEGIMSVKEAVQFKIKLTRDAFAYGDEDDRMDKYDHDEVDKVLETYKNTYYHLNEDMVGEWSPDPQHVKNEAKDVTLLTLKEDLVEAIASRRQ